MHITATAMLRANMALAAVLVLPAVTTDSVGLAYVARAAVVERYDA